MEAGVSPTRKGDQKEASMPGNLTKPRSVSEGERI